MKILFSVSAILILCFLSSALSAQQLAFPGAEGYGKYASGGRGGRVVEVTNLEDVDDYGRAKAGSLRAALNTEGDDPITIVFRVSGNIALKTELKSGRSNMTIAGQTAPGDGIAVKDHSIKLSGDNLIIRYMRFRPGDVLQAETTGLNIENAKNIIVDHCSMSWSVEENTAFYDNVNTTVQWCIISEGLYDSYDPKGPRSYGGQWGGQYASYHHNLLAHNNSRSPRINGSRAHDTIAVVDFRNNVIFNWGSSGAVYGGEEEIAGGKSETNFVNNYYKPGPATADKLYFAAPSVVTEGNEFQGYGAWYFSGNYMEGVSGGMNEDNWLGVNVSSVGSADNIRSEVEFEVSPIVTHSAQEALELVLENAGAVLPERDAIDQRIVAEVGGAVAVIGNGIIDSPSEVGGWPAYESLPPPADTDKDGIADSWETAHALDPEDPEDGSEVSDGGYTNLEIYLNSIAESQHGSEPEPTGLKNAFASNTLRVYPNPTTGKFFFSSSEEVLQVELTDLNGKLVLAKKKSKNEQLHVLEAEQLKTGIYLLRVIFMSGKIVEGKVVKQ